MNFVKYNCFEFKIANLLCFVFFLLLGTISGQSQTPVEKYGQLSVKGNRIVDKNGNPVQLQGMSLYWSMWKPAFYNEATVKWLKDDWCINVIRAAIGIDADGPTSKNGGYYDNPTAEMNRISAVVDAAIKHGIYVIVDFHDHTAFDKLPTAQKFFQDVSAKYKNVPNIIYETFNEPLAVSWSTVIKPYHEAVISTIRANDPDNIIICGTANWSQKVGDPKADPIKGANIAYTLHYYADSHKQWLRDAATAAMSGANGIALFVTEYGTCAADGSGAINETESNAWYKFMEDNSIGHCNWSVANLGETSAIIPTSVTTLGNWPVTSLKPSGVFVRNYLKSKCNAVVLPNDCNNVAGGTATTDACGVCIGGTTGLKPCKTLANGNYFIKPIHSGLCVQTGTTITQQTCANVNTQVWNITKVGNFYEIKNASTGQYLNVASVISTTNLSQSTTTTNRQWRLEDAGNGSYHLVPSTNFQVLSDVSGGSTAANITLGLWTRTEADNQRFSFVPAIITSIEEESSSEYISCFPNPFFQSFKITATDQFYYTITDMTGNLLEKGNAQGAISVGNELPSGLYLIKVTSQSKSVSFKVTKQ